MNFDPIEISQDIEKVLHKSYVGFYTLQPAYSRPIDKFIAGKGITNESLHFSVLERYLKDSKYRPKNLVDYFKRHPLN